MKALRTLPLLLLIACAKDDGDSTPTPPAPPAPPPPALMYTITSAARYHLTTDGDRGTGFTGWVNGDTVVYSEGRSGMEVALIVTVTTAVTTGTLHVDSVRVLNQTKPAGQNILLTYTIP